MLYISCFLLERLREALSWFNVGASGTAGLMCSVGMFTSKRYDAMSSK